jgi:hypothetical protein
MKTQSRSRRARGGGDADSYSRSWTRRGEAAGCDLDEGLVERHVRAHSAAERNAQV